MKIKENMSLIIGISIPALMVILIAASIYLPGIFIKPKFNFLYYSGGDYYAGDSYCPTKHDYLVQDEKLVKNEIKPSEFCTSPEKREIRLFIHNVVKNESKQVSFEKAQTYVLDPNLKSPDGFEIVYGRRGDGFFSFFFWSSQDHYTRYLTGHNISKKLNIQTNENYYNNFHFLGWIKED